MKKNLKGRFGAEKWGGYAACYDALNALAPYRELQKTVAGKLAPEAGDAILDAGCGTGNLAAELLKTGGGADFRIWAADFSPEMLERARRKCRDGRVSFLRADLNRTPPFKSGSFGKIASVNSLYALDEPEKILTGFRGLLKKGGLLVVATPKAGYENGLILKEHCGSAKPDACWLDGHSSPERERLLIAEAVKDKEAAEKMAVVAEYNRAIRVNDKFHFFTRDELAELTERSGFKITKIGAVYAGQGILVEARKEEK